jgi:hypothetical protein
MGLPCDGEPELGLPGGEGNPELGLPGGDGDPLGGDPLGGEPGGDGLLGLGVPPDELGLGGGDVHAPIASPKRVTRTSRTRRLFMAYLTHVPSLELSQGAR